MEDHLKSLFDGVPGPSPWYVRPGTPTVEGFSWGEKPAHARRDATEPFQTQGKTLLVGAMGPVAIFSLYNWIMQVDNSTLLAWSQANNEDSVRLVLFRPSALSAFDNDLENIERDIAASGDMMALSGPPIASFTLSTTILNEDVAVEFPEELHRLTELLVLCKSSSIQGISGMKGSLALLVAKPCQGSFRIYPQDWFNSADIDLGYQWVTRVVRNPQSGGIHGEGIRIRPFELDESLRQTVDRHQSV